MRVCVVGSGGREHALAHVLARTAEVVVTPGNPGIPGSTPVPATDVEADLYVIGPEVPLVAGLADELRAGGKLVYGPGADGARLEGSKAYLKDLLAAAGVPTARYGAFSEEAPAVEFLRRLPGPWVVKTDGLAAGKGVLVAHDLDAAIADVRAKLSGASFGDAGRTVVIEEGLAGPELSVLAVCDGRRAVPLAPAQDFKRALDGDGGPNTGGMGAYSPAPVVTPNVHARVMQEIILPTVAGMARDGAPYTGFLYAGLMIDAQGQPRTVEFNCRLGDPEAQVILMRLKSDLFEVLMQATDGTLDQVELQWDRRVALGVVMAAQGYPAAPRSGDTITGLPAGNAELQVFHAGTALDDGRLLTSGGRVLCVTALGESVRLAQQRALETVCGIRFEGAQWRNDIGHRAIKH